MHREATPQDSISSSPCRLAIYLYKALLPISKDISASSARSSPPRHQSPLSQPLSQRLLLKQPPFAEKLARAYSMNPPSLCPSSTMSHPFHIIQPTHLPQPVHCYTIEFPTTQSVFNHLLRSRLPSPPKTHRSDDREGDSIPEASGNRFASV